MAKLSQIGMTEKEARIYIAMLEKPEMSAGDLHRVSGVPRSKTYETLEKMLTKGFCEERAENNRRYFRAVQPSFLEEILHDRWQSQFNSMKEASKSVFGFLESKFHQIQNSNPSLQHIEILRNLGNIRMRYLNLVNGTEKELLTFNRSPYACLDPKVLEEQQHAICDLPKKDVKLKSIYMWEDNLDYWLKPSIKKAIEGGEEVRISENLPIKMMLFDRKRVLLALGDVPGESQADFTMVVIEDSGLIQSCLVLFDFLWDGAMTYEKWRAEYINK